MANNNPVMGRNPRRANSFRCPQCGYRCIGRKTTIMSPQTRTKSYQCLNIDCSMTFDTTEEITKVRVDSGIVSKNQIRMF